MISLFSGYAYSVKVTVSTEVTNNNKVGVNIRYPTNSDIELHQSIMNLTGLRKPDHKIENCRSYQLWIKVSIRYPTYTAIYRNTSIYE